MSEDSSSDNSLQDPGIFDGHTAWFSKSVQRHRKKAWRDGDGQVTDLESAMFVFSEDASCQDTLRIYESPTYLSDNLAIFHASYIDDCVKKQDLNQVVLGKYFLPPASLQPEIKKQGHHHVHWESHTKKASVEKATHEVSDSSPTNQSRSLAVNLSAYIPMEALTPATGELEEFVVNQTGCSIKIKAS